MGAGWAHATVDGRILNFRSAPNPSGLNQAVDITADINWEDIKPTGTMTFYDGGVVIAGCGDLAMNGNGSGPTCTTRFNTAGDHMLTVTYSGDATYPAGQAGPIDQVVDASTRNYPRFYEQITTTDSANTQARVYFGVSGGDQVATGTATFSEGLLVRCADVPLQPLPYLSGNGGATCDFPVNAGSHTITVTYSGDANYRPGTTSATSGTAGYNNRRMDFDHDGEEDQLVRGDDGSLTAWLMNRLDVKGTIAIASDVTPQDVIKAADLDGDGTWDVVRQRPDGSATLYRISGGTVTPYALRAAGSGWHLTHTADLNGDGKADLLWRNDNGSVELWLMDGGTTLATSVLMPPGSPWSIQAIGDFNDDLRYDLVWQNAFDHSVGMWLMDGATVLERKTIMPAGTGWTPAYAADLEFDAMADLIWKNTDGSVGAWRMNGTTVVQRRTLMGPDTGWSLTQVGGLNYTQPHFLAWTHTDGSVGIWDMNGLDVRNRQSEMGPGTGWHLTDIGYGDGTGGALVWTHDSRAVGMWWLPYLTVNQRKAELPAGATYTVITHEARTAVAP
ncbi:MAG TPA: Ig-like domain repeat protein [Usitatibacter sp.]|jgi:hypothetical protein|nr:Ig-like domain repeat protein [Usitatibacter sp.]